ncbi:SpoIIIAH-like family protein [Litchfieldia alkalitelluris]|uniref:SpoIIIAH-like family protein n=1 Tax=Litchfieldia alkalitelluris TaxID=304268 RepID=UPI000997BCAA|nr:SpoIIIAH-like family protein [Litchfieldia alkalitelluris]
MLLKKQTVWLLTMLSLVVVLSVYYITSPDVTNENVAFDSEGVNEEGADTETGATAKDEAANDEAAAEEGVDVSLEEAEDGSMISHVESDELFTALRMEIEDYRSKVKSELQARIVSKDLTAEEKNAAYEEMRELDAVASTESFLEILIKGRGYDDALVRADGNEVKVTVKGKESSAADANEIMRLVRNEIDGLQNVTVSFDVK